MEMSYDLIAINFDRFLSDCPWDLKDLLWSFEFPVFKRAGNPWEIIIGNNPALLRYVFISNFSFPLITVVSSQRI